MRINREELKKICTERNLSISQLASIVGIDQSTLYRKMNGHSDFYRWELLLIKDALNLEPAKMMQIFFDKNLHKCK